MKTELTFHCLYLCHLLWFYVEMRKGKTKHEGWVFQGKRKRGKNEDNERKKIIFDRTTHTHLLKKERIELGLSMVLSRPYPRVCWYLTRTSSAPTSNVGVVWASVRNGFRRKSTEVSFEVTTLQDLTQLVHHRSANTNVRYTAGVSRSNSRARSDLVQRFFSLMELALSLFLA